MVRDFEAAFSDTAQPGQDPEIMRTTVALRIMEAIRSTVQGSPGKTLPPDQRDAVRLLDQYLRDRGAMGPSLRR
jgi:hypothetical protein